MKQMMQWPLFIAIFCIGVQALKASEQPLIPNWVTIQDQTKHLEVSFPCKPIQMAFDLPLESTEQMGHLDVYSAPFDKGLCMLTVLSYPFFVENELEQNHFKEIFYSFIVKRMFYFPQVFQDHQTFESEKISWQGHPAIRFLLTYQDKQITKVLSGITTLKERKLYTLFYLNSENEFKKQFVNQFLDSLHFLGR